MISIDKANADVREMYADLKEIVDDVVKKHSKDVDATMKKIRSNIDTLSNKEIRELMLKLSIEAYELASTKDLALLREECSYAIMKEAQADTYNGTAGTAQQRNNQAIINTTDKQAVNILYRSVSNCLKTKVDEAHRMVNVLGNVLISKNAEAKLKGVPNDLHSYDDSED